jgi:hypothetical protein
VAGSAPEPGEAAADVSSSDHGYVHAAYNARSGGGIPAARVLS